MQLLNLDKHVKRLTEIARVLTKYGLGGWMKSLDYQWVHGLFKAPTGERISQLSRDERIRLALTELGPLAFPDRSWCAGTRPGCP